MDISNIASAFTSLLDDTTARRVFVNALHGNKCVCPQCKVSIADKTEAMIAGKKIKCPQCGKWFVWTTGTPLAGTKLSPAGSLSVLALLGAGADDVLISRLMNISEETVRLWRFKYTELAK